MDYSPFVKLIRLIILFSLDLMSELEGKRCFRSKWSAIAMAIMSIVLQSTLSRQLTPGQKLSLNKTSFDQDTSKELTILLDPIPPSTTTSHPTPGGILNIFWVVNPSHSKSTPSASTPCPLSLSLHPLSNPLSTRSLTQMAHQSDDSSLSIEIVEKSMLNIKGIDSEDIETVEIVFTPFDVVRVEIDVPQMVYLSEGRLGVTVGVDGKEIGVGKAVLEIRVCEGIVQEVEVSKREMGKKYFDKVRTDDFISGRIGINGRSVEQPGVLYVPFQITNKTEDYHFDIFKAKEADPHRLTMRVRLFSVASKTLLSMLTMHQVLENSDSPAGHSIDIKNAKARAEPDDYLLSVSGLASDPRLKWRTLHYTGDTIASLSYRSVCLQSPSLLHPGFKDNTRVTKYTNSGEITVKSGRVVRIVSVGRRQWIAMSDIIETEDSLAHFVTVFAIALLSALLSILLVRRLRTRSPTRPISLYSNDEEGIVVNAGEGEEEAAVRRKKE